MTKSRINKLVNKTGANTEHKNESEGICPRSAGGADSSIGGRHYPSITAAPQPFLIKAITKNTHFYEKIPMAPISVDKGSQSALTSLEKSQPPDPFS